MVGLLRVLAMILKWLLIITTVSGLMVVAFITFMNMANIAVLVNDGMDMRAKVMFNIERTGELGKFFTVACIQSDTMLSSNPYTDYHISTIASKSEIQQLTTLPWSDSASVTLTYAIPEIEGSLPLDKQTPEQLQNPNKILPPDWQTGKYELMLVKVDNKWKIASLTLKETVKPESTQAALGYDA
jgi:hypothetical protein